MKMSESVAALAKALAGVQGELENPKNTAVNPHFRNKYAPLNEVLNATRPILAKHGLSVVQVPSGDGQNIVITTLLLHESGEWLEADPLTLKADKPTAQGAGSAITYGRRYALSALLGISSEDDDDANHATGSEGESKPAPKASRPTASASSAPQQGSGTVQPPTAAQRNGKAWEAKRNFVNTRYTNLGYKGDERHTQASAVLGRVISSLNECSMEDFDAILKALKEEEDRREGVA